MQAPVLELTNLFYAYNQGENVLSDISLSFSAGESIAILGANGCGKSTLLKILSGLLHPTSGSLRAFGREVTEKTLQERNFLAEFRQRVGFIFQNSDAQLFSATVRDELSFAPLQAGLPPQVISERVRDVADLLEISHLLDRPPYRLSGGEKKKVALASVLSVNPDILFLDEPTNGLDPRTQYWLVEFLTALHLGGKTIITATHDLSIVEDIAERIIIFRENHTIAADGLSLSLLSDRQLLLEVNLIHNHSHFHVGASRQHG